MNKGRRAGSFLLCLDMGSILHWDICPPSKDPFYAVRNGSRLGAGHLCWWESSTWGSSSSGLVCSPSCWLGWQRVRAWTSLAAGLHPSWASPVWKGATTTFRTLSETQAFTGSPWGSPLPLSTAGLFTLTINYFLLLKELHQEAQLQIAMLKALRSNAAFHYQRQQDKYYFTCMDPEFLRNLFIKWCFFCCGKL